MSARGPGRRPLREAQARDHKRGRRQVLLPGGMGRAAAPPTEKAMGYDPQGRSDLPKAIIDAVPKEDPSETGKLDILAFADESGLTASVLDSLQQHKHVGAKKVVNVYGNDDLLDAEKVEELLADQWDVVVFGAGADSPESSAIQTTS